MNYNFKKKPIVIQAFHMTEDKRIDNSEWPNWMHDAWNKYRASVGSLYPTNTGEGTGTLSIMTLEGPHLVTFGDWIIRGVMGEIYPCKPAIFDLTYEEICTTSV